MRFQPMRFTFAMSLLFSLIIVLPNIPTRTDTEPSNNASLGRNNNEPAGQNKTIQNNARSGRQLQSSSPYDIALLITDNPRTDLTEIWNALGIKRLNFGEDYDVEPDERTKRFLTECQRCDAETYAYDLDGEPGNEVLLRVSDRLTESCRYLVFKRLKGRKPEWKLLGHIDHGFGRYSMPEHRIVLCGGGRDLLVVKVQEGSGSGFALYCDRLVQVDSTGLKEILEFPSEGHLSTCCYYPTREFTTRIRDCELTGDATTVELEFEVSYSASIDSDKVQLWHEKQKATYNTDGKSNRLVLDSSKSDLSKEEIDAIYGGEGLGDEKFIKYNNDRLTEIATGPESVRKEWLRRFLGEEEQSSEKAHLRQLLKR